MIDDDEMTDSELCDEIKATLELMRQMKPDERGEKTRRYAVAITEMEKVYAYFAVYVVGIDRRIDPLTGLYVDE